MLKNKFLVLSLTLLACITTHSTIQSKQINKTQRARQTQPRKSQQQVQQQTRLSTTTQQRRLSDFDFHAASVLLTFIDKNGDRYLILSREADGDDKGTYDDFGGKRDLNRRRISYKKQPLPEKEPHPVITAAREFFEEAILGLSIGFSRRDTYFFIDVEQPNTQYVIAYGHNVTYITDFSIYKDTFFDNFYTAFNTTTSPDSKEKDRIAIVEWNKLKTTINNAKFNSGVVIDARVLNPQNLTWNNEQITLRGFFVKKLRPFWADKPYEQGMSNKIRFYSDTITPAIKGTLAQKPLLQQPSAQQQQSWINRFWNWIKS